MTLNCYLNFKGNCREAMEFYGFVFDVEPKILTFGEMPAQEGASAQEVPEEAKNLVVHGNLEICGNLILFSDVLSDREFIRGNNVSLSISSPDKRQLTEWFQRLSDGANIEMPLGPTFWSPLYGCLVDRFGMGWQVNCTE